TPSAQVLATLKAKNQSYEAFILEQSKLHKNTFIAAGLSDEDAAMFADKSAASLIAQKEIELADRQSNQSFDVFLDNYFSRD
ncbi:MAG: glutamate--cysteine ligase, partial [Pontibacterium sp.]